MENSLLSGQDLVQVFGSGGNETRALRGVSLDLPPGKVTLVMGPSGCGKTTLLAVMAGLLKPTSGRVLTAGREDLYDLSDTQRREFRRKHVGFIFQGFHLFPTLTVREQLEMVLRWGENASPAEAGRHTDEMLEMLNLKARSELFPQELSGGEKQRVAIGRALIKMPDLFFADEPTSALDWNHGKQVMEILARAARERSAAVLVVAHDTRVLPFADRTLHMEDGAWKDGEPTGEPPGRARTDFTLAGRDGAS
jgi:putative ABC transport system ATP-binding protein